MNRVLLAMIVAAALGGMPESAQAQGGHSTSAGHSVTGPGVSLLGIEPYPAASGTGSASDIEGKLFRVQYPLDNDAYKGPDPQTPQGYPMYAPGVQGTSPQGVAPSTPWSAMEPEGWITLGQSTWEASWVLGGSDPDSLGIFTNEFRTKLKFPDLRVLTLSPRFGWHLVDGPFISDLPPQLYDASLEAMFAMPVREGWFVQAAVSPSLFTDGQNLSGDAFRLPGRLLVFWSCTETVTLSGGVVYLDREDVSILPAFGVVWKPTEDWKIEAIMPRPRVAWRYDHDSSSERWLYLVGEFGGGSWAVERANGRDDVATVSDLRFLGGWELTRTEGAGCRVEGGLVFDRTLEYTSVPGEQDLPATGLVRFSLMF
jgi:hypothetical protein